MPELPELESMKYLRASNLQRDKMRGFARPDIRSAPPYKTYPDAEVIPLPRTWDLEEARITKLLQERRSRRKYKGEEISLTQLSYLLWASQGVTASSGQHLFRTAPSAGALYPIETYLFILNVHGVKPGVYHFNVLDFSLELVGKGSHNDDLVMACLNQKFIDDACVVFCWTSIFRRNFSKYGERGMRYVFIDAGHICQNVILASEALRLGSCPIAAFFDEEVNELLRIDSKDESALYLAAIGTK